MLDFTASNKKHQKILETQLTEASQKYKRVFESADGEWVLKDLAKRSFDNMTTYDADKIKMGINEGRRSLYKYIKGMVTKNLQTIIEELTKE